MREGSTLKFWTPGGSSTPILTDEHLDVPLDYEGVAAAGSMLGTKALQIFDETTSVVRCVLRWTEFYKHESCGKCTPCREGTWWLVQTLAASRPARAPRRNIATLARHVRQHLGRSFCALGDGAPALVPARSSTSATSSSPHAHPRGAVPFDQPHTVFRTWTSMT
jgi:NADH-quinone oxidoreductase subunit F